MTSHIPAQFQPKSIKRFETIFALVNSSHPNPIKVSFEGYAFETFTCRFRDAVKGIVKHNQCPELLHLVKEWCNDFSIGALKGTQEVLIGGKKEVRQAIKSNVQIGTVIDANVSLPNVESPSEKVLVAILVLLNSYTLPDATLRGVNQNELNRLIPLHCPDRDLEIIVQNSTLILL